MTATAWGCNWRGVAAGARRQALDGRSAEAGSGDVIRAPAEPLGLVVPRAVEYLPALGTIRIGGRDGDAPPRAVALATAHPDVNYRVAGEPALDPERLVCVWNPIAHGVLLLDCSMG
jgi:hypothetical protein